MQHWSLNSAPGHPLRWHCRCGIIQMIVQHYPDEQVQRMRYQWWVTVNGLRGGNGYASCRQSAMTSARRWARRTLVQALGNVVGHNVKKWTAR